jgi:hypothetical protein
MFIFTMADKWFFFLRYAMSLAVPAVLYSRILLGLILDALGAFVCMWLFYEIRERMLNHMMPSPQQYSLSEILPPTCYVQNRFA